MHIVCCFFLDLLPVTTSPKGGVMSLIPDLPDTFNSLVCLCLSLGDELLSQLAGKFWRDQFYRFVTVCYCFKCRL